MRLRFEEGEDAGVGGVEADGEVEKAEHGAVLSSQSSKSAAVDPGAAGLGSTPDDDKATAIGPIGARDRAVCCEMLDAMPKGAWSIPE